MKAKGGLRLVSEKEAIYYELLILRCRRQDGAAMEELIRHWERRLFYYIRRLADNEEDAWEILQQTWFKVIQKIDSLRQPRTLAVWLYQIARNTAINHLRDKIKKRHLLEDKKSEAPVNVEEDDNTFRFDDADRVHYGLGRLSLPYREVLTLHFLEELSIDQIAEIVNIQPGTVKSRLYYAKQALRAVLEKEDRKHE
jgi:RNA polymerase sigma-70 factor (ECF subfamily)